MLPALRWPAGTMTTPPQTVLTVDDGAPLGAISATELGPYVEPLGLLHSVLCPRQVLGVRMALLAGRELALPFPQRDKRLITIVETDGCLADGLSVVTGCTVGHRTLRVVDLGKIAATFVDTVTERSMRIAPRPGVRERALSHADHVPTLWHAQRDGYARMPAEELLSVVAVKLRIPLAAPLSDWQERVTCQLCAEEVMNGRQVVLDGAILCRHCAGAGYLVDCWMMRSNFARGSKDGRQAVRPNRLGYASCASRSSVAVSVASRPRMPCCGAASTWACTNRPQH